MTNLIVVLGLLVSLGVLGLVWLEKQRQAGQDRAKKEQAEGALESAKKAKDAINRLDDDKRKRLRERYDIK